MAYSFIKRILVLAGMLFGISLSIYASSEDITLKVRRGDSWVSIADRYGINPEDLKAANGDIAECYIGMTVIVPGDLIDEAAEERRIKAEEAKAEHIENLYELADIQESTGDYKKAVKTYTEIIGENPSAYAYYSRGLAQYNRQKWSQAASDLSIAAGRNDASDELKEHAKRLSAEAQRMHEQQAAQTARVVADIVGMAANVVSTTIAAHELSKADKAVAASSRPASSYSSDRRGSRRSESSTRRSSSTRTSASRSNTKKRTSTSKTSTARTSTTPRRQSRPYNPSASSTRSVSPPAGMSVAPAASAVTRSGGKLSSQEVYDRYLSPEAFVYNYTHGLPTLPSSQQMGLTGSDAYAYDLQRNLQHQSQLMDLNAAIQTEKNINAGMEAAKKEISQFSSIYGREPTAEEIEAIYKKHTQGYIDAYTDYLNDNINTAKELGLGEISTTKASPSGSSGDTTANSSGDNSDTDGQKVKNVKNDKNDKETKDKEKAKDDSPDTYTYKQRMVNLYKYNQPTIVQFQACKLYQRRSRYYIEVRGTYCLVQPSNKRGFNRKIVYNNFEYYFNL